MLASYRCCNKSPQTGGFKTTQLYHLNALEVTSPASVSLGRSQGASRSAFLLEAPRSSVSLHLPKTLPLLGLSLPLPALPLQTSLFDLCF